MSRWRIACLRHPHHHLRILLGCNGNLITEPGYAYNYDAENRLVSLNNGAWTYSYDGNGLRVKRTNGSTGARTGYIYDGANIIAEYLNGAGAQWPGAEWIYQDGRYLAPRGGRRLA